MQDERRDRPKPQYPIESVDNALRLIQMYQSTSSLRVTDAAEALGVAVSTAYRLLAMLQYHGFVEQPPGSKAYVAGPTLLDVGVSVVGRLELPVIARPVLEKLSGEVQETAHLLSLEGRRVRFLDGVEGPKTVRVTAQTGAIRDAHSTSAGKAMLAELDPGLVRQIYPDDDLATDNGRGLQTRAQLEDELTRIRARGYATNLRESEDEVSAVGMAIVDRRGQLRGAISISAPSQRLIEEEIPSIVPALERAVESIAEALT